MSGNDQDYDNQNDAENYDDDNQDQNQEYDSQDDNFQNNDSNCDDDDQYENDNSNGNDDENGNGHDNENNDNDDDENDDNGSYGPKYIRLRGLPWSATHKEILDFLKNVNVVGGAEGIHLITSRWDGKNTGEAYVEVKSQQDVAAAMKLDNATMGHRYIEVFNAAPKEAKEAMRKTSGHGTSYVVKLRGLPYSVTEQQVEEFFNGLEIKPDREGIIFVMDRRGRATGEAFVQFESQEDTEQALGRNREKIGHRYIEIFRSSMAELKRATSGNGRMAPYDLKDRGSNRGNNNNDFIGNNRNRWGGSNGGFGVGASNTLGFNNLPNFANSGNFGNNNGGNFGNYGNNGVGRGGGNFGNFGNNGNFGNFGNNSGSSFGNNLGGDKGGNNFNRFSGNSGNFGNDFGDFGNFGNNRNGGGNNKNGGGGNFNNFSNFGNNMGGGFNNKGGGGNFGPIGGGRNDDFYIVHMRGLPFNSFENDVFKFFDPIRPANVRIHYNDKNRHNGTAEALFESYEDVQLAMKRHCAKMGSRYIELFFNGKVSKGGNNYSSGGSVGVSGSNFSRRI